MDDKLFDYTKPFETRSGYPARLLCDPIDREKYRYVVAYRNEDGEEETITCDEKGRLNSFAPHSLDLVNIPVIHERFFNVARNSRGLLYCYGIYESRELADKCAKDRIACLEIRFNEGEGL